MPDLKVIRKRIASVKNTQKITRAMKLVAAARLRKAQENITRMRPYALQTLRMLSSLAARTGDDEALHPLLARREPKNVMLVVLTSDRGLAGSFNVSVSKAAFRHYKELSGRGIEVGVGAIGKKGRDYLRRRGVPIRREFGNVYEDLSYRKASDIGDAIVTEYAAHDLDAVHLVYNEFKSAISQKVTIEPLLPIEPMAVAENESASDYLYEPDQRTILDTLLPLYVNVEVYRALLESVASEHGARMTAMENATNNAKDLIASLTIQANRARQAAITKELMEIIGGAEALKG
jgi:F-type H+-transporting ATPase subunit gamma